MKDVAIKLENRPGALAEMGEALAEAGISIEGGGAWTADNGAVAHFLFDDDAVVRKTLENRGIRVVKETPVLIQRLKQDQPGQLGKIARLMQLAGVNIEVVYSDHQNHLILVVDNLEKGRAVSENWKKGT